MSSEDIERSLKRIAHEILEKNKGASELLLIGIFTRGVFLANRLVKYINEIEHKDLKHGALDITMFRDDYQTHVKTPLKSSDIGNVKDKTVILVDDVLFTGRTIRAALDAILEFGRPKKYS